MTATAPSVDQNLDAACASVTTEFGRTDGKASLLLAFNGAVLAGLASLADHHLPAFVQAAGGAACAALAAACVLLLLVVRPNLRGHDRASFPYWAQLDVDEIRASMTSDTRPARIHALSTVVLRKYVRLRRAVDCTLTALALLAAAALGTLV